MVSSPVRWPHADKRRRIPTRAYKGETPDCTAALRECVYLDELERQARIFTRSFSEAMTAALVADDAEECWRQLQSSMSALQRIVPLGARLHPRTQPEQVPEGAMPGQRLSHQPAD
jgi:hypothetical protein